MAKRKVLGIDLGTTYSCVAYVNDYGKPEVLLNQRDERTTPSVVWFDGNRIIVGEEAKEMTATSPNSVCSFIKRQMGKDDYTFEVDGVQYSPEHISSFILRKLVQDAWARLGEEVKDVVITCPAYFFIKERNATKQAGEMAGLNVLQIVNEPSAAAVDYGIQVENETGTILVYDLGGGTFDVTVMSVSPNGLDVICTDGDHQLGGKDWDDMLAHYFAERFAEESGMEVDLTNDTEFYYDLLQQAEEVKKHLSVKTSVSVRLSYQGNKVKFDMTREEFEERTSGLIDRTIFLTTKCLESAQNHIQEMPSQIILVGGSSRMPQVAARLTAEYGLEPVLFDPDEAVAKGAAIIGNNILLKEKVREKLSHSRSLLIDDVPDSQKQAAAQKVAEETGMSLAMVNQALRPVRNVSSKTFGAVSTDESGFRSVSNIIYRNSTLPCEETQTFVTLSDYQTEVLIELMENDTERSLTYEQDMEELLYGQGLTQERFEELYWRVNTKEEESVKLWEGPLQLPVPLPANSPIDLTYRLDESGQLTLIATEPQSGEKLVYSIQTGKVEQETPEYKKATQKSRSLIID